MGKKHTGSEESKRFRAYLRAKDDIHECYLRGNFFLCHFLKEVGLRIKLARCR